MKNRIKRINKLLLIVLFLFIITGCRYKQTGDYDRIYLDNAYYNKGDFIKMNTDEFNEIKDGSYVLFVHYNYCTLKVSCDTIFQEFMKDNKIDFIDMMFDDYKNTEFFKEVPLAPTIIVVDKGEIIAYLDSAKDEDLDKYQNSEEFTKWIDQYIFFKK